MLHMSVSAATKTAFLDTGGIDIIKLDTAAVPETVRLKVLTMVNTNSDGLGEELRPLPWASFVCEIGPMHLMESCTQSEGVREEVFDAMPTKRDITVVLTSTASISQVCATLPTADMRKELQVGNVMPFDLGRKLQSRLPLLLAIPPSRAEVCVLPGCLEDHDLLDYDTTCTIFPTTNSQWSSKISSCGILTNCQQSNMPLVDALESRVTWETSATGLTKGLYMMDATARNLTVPWNPGGLLINRTLPNGSRGSGLCK